MNRLERIIEELPPLADQPHAEVLRFCTLGGFKVLARHSHPEVGFYPEVIEYIADCVDRIRHSASERLQCATREELMMHRYVQAVTHTPDIDEMDDVFEVYRRRFEWFAKKPPRDREVESIGWVVNAWHAVAQHGETDRIRDARFLYGKQTWRRQINPEYDGGEPA